MRTLVDSFKFDDIMTSLLERGWVERRKDVAAGGEEFQLTEEGRRRHEAIFATRKEVRRRAMQGIGEEEYATVIRVLQQIAGNARRTNWRTHSFSIYTNNLAAPVVLFLATEKTPIFRD